ncbi:hypothetical protein L6R53_16445 [Myxococcota bacterium]|nr:hypothetical protein [Myxococcota bacterium]
MRRLAAWSVLLALAVGCAPAAPPPTAQVLPAGLAVRAEEGVDRVALLDPEGRPVLTRRLPAPTDEVVLDWAWPRAGTWTAEVTTARGPHRLPLQVEAPAPPLVARVEAPLGQDPVPLVDGLALELPLVDGRPAPVALTVRAVRPGPVEVQLGDERQQAVLSAGERLTVQATVGLPTALRVEGGGLSLQGRVLPQDTRLADLARDLSISSVVLPADAEGRADLSRPAGRVALPAAWWRTLQEGLGLGQRGRDPWAPWAHVGVQVDNRSEQPRNVLVRLAVQDEEGRPAPAFAPRAREGTTSAGAVQALLRVPARGSARATLPLFVDEGLLPVEVARSQTWTRTVEVLPLGLPDAVATDRQPLYVSRGSTVASLGLVAAVAAALAGTAMLLRWGPRWLGRARTSELMTISLFGSLTFLVGAVGRLLTVGLATVLGPFATFLTALVDDALRYTLLATLICLLPRPGTASLAVLVGWLLSGFVLGTFSPTDLLFVGGRVLWLELCLWLVGATRGAAWLDQAPWRRWLRLGLGLGLASVLASATGLVLHVTLYRLFLAGWYVAAVLALPGFLYVLLAVGLAVPFAHSLRQVQR